MAKKRQDRIKDEIDKKVTSDIASVGNQQTNKSVDANNTAPTQSQSLDGIVSAEYPKKIDELDKAYAPNVKSPTIDKEQYTDLETKRRKRKWMDIVYGVAKGVSGQSVNPNLLPTKRIAAKQQDMLQQYKDASSKAKAATDSWQRTQYDTRMKWLESAYNNAETPSLKAKYESEILKNKELANKYATEAKWKSKQPYYKPTAAKGNAEETASYTYKTEGGQTLKMDVSKDDANTLNRFVLEVDRLKQDKEALNKKMLRELSEAEGGKWSGIGMGESKADAQKKIRKSYAADMALLDDKIRDKETNISDTFKKNTSNSEAPTGGDDTDIWDEL